MNSEEVKDIKKTVGYFADKYMTAQCIGVPKRELFADILTLINELETENERLMKLQSRGGCRVAELGIENQQLKDRNAELKNTDYYKEIEKKKEDLLCKEYGLIKYEKEIACKYLKEFAEKLIEKAYSNCKLGGHCQEVVDCYDIDELLKEYEE